MTKNLTEGNPRKVIISYTIPLFISVVFQQIYSIADSVIAGRYAGEDALAAVGASYPVTMIFMAVAMGFQIGCMVVISKNFGSSNMQRTKTCISTSLISGLVLSVILTIPGLLSSKSLMKILDTPDNIFSDSVLYLKIYLGGFVFLFLYNVATGVFNSIGDSKTPLYLLIGSSIGNIILDAVFVINFDLGVAGVAWATFIAQGAACIFSLIILKKRLKTITSVKSPVFSFKEFVFILRIAVPSILQQSFVSVGNLFVLKRVNYFGSSVVAGYSSAIKLNTFAITSFSTLGNGISSFTAQNLGCKRSERVRQGFKAGLIFALSVSVMFFILFFVFAGPFVRMFMEKGNTGLALDTGVEFLKIVTPFYFTVCTKLICDGVLRGSEKMWMFMTSTFTDLIMRVVLSYIFSSFCGARGIWLSWPISWLTATILSVIFYIHTVRHYPKDSDLQNISE